MDSKGNLYANAAIRKMYDEELREHFKPTEDMPADAIGIDAQPIAEALAALNHDARRVYYSERKRGASETEALEAARGSLKP